MDVHTDPMISSDSHIVEPPDLWERWLPKEIAWRPKGMFRAPLDSFFAHKAPPFIDQLLSAESLKKTGWFNVAEVQRWRQRMLEGKLNFRQRSMVELGMVGVVTTQLWYHTFIDSSLADIPGGWQRPQRTHAPELDAV